MLTNLHINFPFCLQIYNSGTYTLKLLGFFHIKLYKENFANNDTRTRHSDVLARKQNRIVDRLLEYCLTSPSKIPHL